MTLEAPVQIDLSSDDSWNQVDDSLLTPEDKQFLRDQFTEESEGIIYLTQQELSTLRASIEATRDPRGEAGTTQIAGESFTNFIREQIEEGLSLSDITGENTAYDEALKEIEAQSYEALFGTDGAFGSLGISDNAKDAISVGFGLSIIEQISRQENLNTEALQSVLTGDVSSFSNNLEGLNLLRELADMEEVDPESDGEMKPVLDLTNLGEGNSIFMDPTEGKSFFNKLLEGEFNDHNAVEEYMESKNTNEAIEQNYDGLAEALNGDFRGIAERIQQAGIDLTDPNIQRDLENGQEDNWLVKIIKAILSGLANFGESLGDLPDTIRDITGEPREEEIAPTGVETIRTSLLSRLGEGALANISSTALQSFFQGENNMEAFLRTIQDIPDYNGQNTPEEKIENLLFTNIESENTPKLLAFIEAGNLGSISEDDGSFNSENFMLAITAYKNYRLSHSEDNSLTYQTFFENNNE